MSAAAKRRRERPGWERLSAPGLPTCAGRFEHRSGWLVEHCGHPTALWPYLLVPPGGGQPVVSFNGQGFASLRVAQEVAERLAAGVLQLEYQPGRPPRAPVTAGGEPRP